jgi:hypothetical protein
VKAFILDTITSKISNSFGSQDLNPKNSHKKISSHIVPCEANFPPTAYSRPVLLDPRPVPLDPRTVLLDPRTVPLDPRLATSTSSPAISK